MGFDVYVNYQVYRPKEKIWESYNIEEKYYDVNSALWSRSYFVSTHGHISDKTIEKYIAEQKGMQ